MFKSIYKLATVSLLGLAAILPAQAADLVIGGKNFTEQQLLTEITAQYLTSHGYGVERRAGLGSTVLRKAQENGQVDLYWEYTGTALIVYNKFKEKLSPADVYSKVKELDEQKGLIWLNSSKANNTYALAMQSAKAKELGIKTLSDLSNSVNANSGLVLAVNAEFYARKDGLKPLQEAYDFKFPRADIMRMDSGLTYTALQNGQVDIALVFATDGRIPAFNFTVLKDDKGYFPDYSLAPVVRKDILDANPKLAAQLNALSGKIDSELMASLNAKVDVDHTSIETVAREFLQNANL